MRIRKLTVCSVALFLALALSMQPVQAAKEFNEARVDSLMDEMFDVLIENPDAGDHLETEMDRVAAEYGGEPSDEEACEAMEKVIEALKRY